MSRTVRYLALLLLTNICPPSLAQNRHSLSPDGTLAAYTSENALWIVSTKTSIAPVKVAPVGDYFAVPRWSPRQNRLAYYSSESGTVQLWIYDPRSARSHQITAVEGGISPSPQGRFSGYVGDPLRYSWSPDGTQIVFASRVPIRGGVTLQFPSKEKLAAGEPIVLDLTTPPEWTLFGVVSYGHQSNRSLGGSLIGRDVPQLLPQRTTQLFVVNVVSGRLVQLTSDRGEYFTPEWSPDGGHIAYMSVDGQSLGGFGPDESSIYVLDLGTGDRRRITEGRTQKTIPRWSPDGKLIAYYGRDRKSGFVRGDEGIFVAPADGTGGARKVSEALNFRITAYEWGGDGDSLLMTYRDGLFQPFVQLTLGTNSVRHLSPPNSMVHGIAGNAKGAIWTELSGPNDATVLRSIRQDERPRALTTLTPAANLKTERRYEVLAWKNSRGESIEGILIYPLDYKPGTTYPAVVDAYSSASLLRVDDVNFVRASPDYFVFRPNHRAPHMWVNPLKSPAYDAGAVGPNGIAIMADDILSGVEMLSHRGLIDQSRMCVVGFSNGGLEGLQLLTQTTRFRCGIFQSPSTPDMLAGLFLSSDSTATIRTMYGIAPWEHPSLYTSLVPLYLADQIHTPILLAVGDQEAAVIPTIEMYNVLRHLKRQVTLLRYSEQGHGFSGAVETDFRRRAAEFLTQYLAQ